MKKLLISSAVAASVLSSAAFAAIATDGTGQYLVAPAYFATSNFSTELKLVNTDLNDSVIMRGVIKEYQSSEESDFIILLSPGDVWEATITKGSDGKVYLNSDDDSNYNSAIKNADLAKNLETFTSYAATKSTNAKALKRTYTSGYVEFYPIVSIASNPNNFVTPIDGASNFRVSKPVPKQALKNFFDDVIRNSKNNGVPGTISFATTITDANDARYGKAFDLTPNNTIKQVGNDQVAGYVTLKNPALNAAMTINMMAFEDVVDFTGTTIVASNPTRFQILEREAGEGNWTGTAISGLAKLGIPIGTNGNIFGDGVEPGKHAYPAFYLGNNGMNAVLDALRNDTASNDAPVNYITVPFENNGKYDMIYTAFIFDGNGGWYNSRAGASLKAVAESGPDKCIQDRSYLIQSRDMKETRNDVTTDVISPATSLLNSVTCEFAAIPVQTILEGTGSLGFEKGMAQIIDMRGKGTDTLEGDKASSAVIPSHLRAVKVGNGYSYSWLNVAAKRKP